MKRINNLYEKMLSKEYIQYIIRLASKGKTKRGEVQYALAHIDKLSNKIYQMLLTGNFTLLPTHNREIIEKGKKRKLTISPFFPNRILDYLIVETVKPYIKKSMYPYCIGNVDGKGMMYGKKIIARKHKHYKYYIKLDIHKFYPSVSSQKMYDFIESKIKDKRYLALCKTVILSEKDLPIGSYYSQWFSNWFLQDIDHKIKEELKVPFYIRYVDDMVLMSNNKRNLKNAMYCIGRMLNEKGLQLKRIEQVKSIEQTPLDFIGFRFGKDHIYLRTRNFKKLNKRVKRIRKKKHICVSQARSLLSYTGWLKQIPSGYRYYVSYIKPYVKLGFLKRIISAQDLKANKGESYVRMQNLCA